MKRWIANAFSLSMIAGCLPAILHVREIRLDEAKRLATEQFREIESVVGHAETAAIFSEQLGIEVAHNRISVCLPRGDEILVGQYFGPRLPEGATSLPADATIKWYLVENRH